MTSQTLGFQTEAKKLLHLMINSLYSNKEVFLRELISNSSDAIDKLRFKALSEPDLLAEDEELKISIDFDEKALTLSVTDNGIGMTREEVVENLGTIAKSGTEEFFDMLTGDQQKDAALIGQFGVGFYSSFMVADEVSVLTRKAGSDQGTHWMSKGEEEFTVDDAEAPRGTSVILKLKDDAKEYASYYRLRQIVRRYSDHIAVPVYMPDHDGDNDTTDWVTVNEAKALWMRSRSEISDDEYKEFYKHISHDFEDPIAWSHNKVEGKLEYTSLLYIPKRAPWDLFNPNFAHGLKLYIHRVFVLDEAEVFLPSYLRFVKGVVDSSDLPLNVSRETLQKSRSVENIRNAIGRRVLERLEKLAVDDCEAFGEFWDNFGNVLKEGTPLENPHRETLMKLLRFATTHDENTEREERTSLRQYVDRASSDQTYIYYVIGENERIARNSPHLEVFLKQGIEVLLLNDAVDAWMMSHLSEFDGKKFQDITRSNLDLPKAAEGKKDDKDDKVDNDDPFDEDLLQRMKTILDDKVESVAKSNRLVDSPACLVLGVNDVDVHVRRLLEASGQEVPMPKPSLEVNTDHALVQHLVGQSDETLFSDIVHILYEQAALAAGSFPIEAGAHVKRVNRLLTDLLV